MLGQRSLKVVNLDCTDLRVDHRVSVPAVVVEVTVLGLFDLYRLREGPKVAVAVVLASSAQLEEAKRLLAGEERGQQGGHGAHSRRQIR